MNGQVKKYEIDGLFNATKSTRKREREHDSETYKVQ